MFMYNVLYQARLTVWTWRRRREEEEKAEREYLTVDLKVSSVSPKKEYWLDLDSPVQISDSNLPDFWTSAELM